MLVFLVQCHHAPLFIPEGATITQGRVILKGCLTTQQEPQVFWAEVMGPNWPTLECELSQGGERVRMPGMVDTGADITVISCRELPQAWELEST